MRHQFNLLFNGIGHVNNLLKEYGIRYVLYKAFRRINKYFELNKNVNKKKLQHIRLDNKIFSINLNSQKKIDKEFLDNLSMLFVLECNDLSKTLLQEIYDYIRKTFDKYKIDLKFLILTKEASNFKISLLDIFVHQVEKNSADIFTIIKKFLPNLKNNVLIKYLDEFNKNDFERLINSINLFQHIYKNHRFLCLDDFSNNIQQNYYSDESGIYFNSWRILFIKNNLLNRILLSFNMIFPHHIIRLHKNNRNIFFKLNPQSQNFIEKQNTKNQEFFYRLDTTGPDISKFSEIFLFFNTSLDNIVIFDHNLLGGGSSFFIREYIKSNIDKNNCILIRYDYLTLGKYIVDFFLWEKRESFIFNSFADLIVFLNLVGFRKIVVNSLVSYQDVFSILEYIRNIKKFWNVSIEYMVHDYFCICPSYHLIDWQFKYCGIPKDYNVCNYCIKNNRLDFQIFGYKKYDEMRLWRKYWGDFFKKVDDIVCFSNSSKEILLKAYSELNNIVVRPHKLRYSYPNIYDEHDALTNIQNEKIIRIGILGSINIPKGAYIIKELLKHIEANNLNFEIVLIGEISIPIFSKKFIKTGRYKREEVPEIINKYKINFFLLPSVCPETYSLVTDEIMQLGYPLVVFDVGAPPERVRKYRRGLVLKTEDYLKILDKEYINKMLI